MNDLEYYSESFGKFAGKFGKLARKSCISAENFSMDTLGLVLGCCASELPLSLCPGLPATNELVRPQRRSEALLLLVRLGLTAEVLAAIGPAESPSCLGLLSDSGSKTL